MVMFLRGVCLFVCFLYFLTGTSFLNILLSFPSVRQIFCIVDNASLQLKTMFHETIACSWKSQLVFRKESATLFRSFKRFQGCRNRRRLVDCQTGIANLLPFEIV